LTVLEMPISPAICATCMSRGEMLIISDMLADPAWQNHPCVTEEPYVRFYAGVPLVTPDDHILGTICVLDQVPHTLSEEQTTALRVLARQVVAQLELHRHLISLSQSITERQQAEAQIQQQAALLDIATDAILVRDLDHRIKFWNQGAERLFGWSATAQNAGNQC
jgi:GAF domain-containing protein